jgi:hypothetical protein
MKKLTLFVAALFVSAMTVGAVAQTTSSTQTPVKKECCKAAAKTSEASEATTKCKNCTKATTGKCCKDRLNAKGDSLKGKCDKAAKAGCCKKDSVAAKANKAANAGCCKKSK